MGYKTCFKCGQNKETLLLSERVFHCEHCHFEIGRNFKAAINLSQAGRLLVSSCGLDKAYVSRTNHEVITTVA